MNQYMEIGKPKDGWLCTTVINHDYKDFISYNDVSYWCSFDHLGLEVKIGKQSPEGEKITKAILSKVSPKHMEAVLLSVILPNLEPVRFIDIIRHVREEASKEGRNHIRDSLTQLLVTEL